MAQQSTADQYYSDYVIEHEKTSQPLVVEDWSDGEIFSLLKTVTWSEIIEILAGISIIYLMFVLAGIYS